MKMSSKKKTGYIQKTLAIVLTAVLIWSSVPVTAETVSENDVPVTAGEADTLDLEADQAESEDTKVEDGTADLLSYCIYQKTDGTRYVEITDCDRSAEGDIEIPKEINGTTVTSIGDRAFEDCSGLTSITIPEGVTSIEGYAFYRCRGLTGITIPEGVTSIGDSAFDYCSGLTGITIPKSVTSM